ncbi:MAG TPA: hypothetical protein VLG12_02960, partial [Candidatus Saccharimonadales bacterium]|nr:hypothetical protein [Candidatus Saccharimonadales bacterium]
KLKLLYFQYRDFFIPVITIFICAIVFLLVVIPQMQAYLLLQNQFAQDQQKLQVLEHNFQKITGLNDQELNIDFNLTTLALPELKNATVILNTISKAASVSNISLKDYTFGLDEQTKTPKEPLLHIMLSLNGNKDQIQKFVHQLSVSLPLSEVSSIDILDNNDATISVTFYIQTISKASINENNPLQLLTDQDKNTINLLSSWQ